MGTDIFLRMAVISCHMVNPGWIFNFAKQKQVARSTLRAFPRGTAAKEKDGIVPSSIMGRVSQSTGSGKSNSSVAADHPENKPGCKRQIEPKGRVSEARTSTTLDNIMHKSSRLLQRIDREAYVTWLKWYATPIKVSRRV